MNPHAEPPESHGWTSVRVPLAMLLCLGILGYLLWALGPSPFSGGFRGEVERSVHALGDSHPRSRAVAAEHLGQLAQDLAAGHRQGTWEALRPAKTPLLERVADADAEVRRLALWALGEIGLEKQEGAPILFEALSDPVEKNAEDALSLLRQSGTLEGRFAEQAYAAVFARVDSTTLRHAGARGLLAHAEAEAAYRYAVSWLFEPDPVLNELGSVHLKDQKELVVEELTASYLKGNGPPQLLSTWIVRFDPVGTYSYPVILEGVKEGRFRLPGLFALARLNLAGDDRLMELLLSAGPFDDRTEYLRVLSPRTLQESGKVKVFLNGILQDRFLTDRFAREILPFLPERLNDPEPEVRAQALKAFSFLAPMGRAHFDAILHALKDRNFDVQYEAVRAAAAFGAKDESALARILEWLPEETSPDEYKGRWLLERIGPPAAAQAVPVLLARLTGVEFRDYYTLRTLAVLGPNDERLLPRFLELLKRSKSPNCDLIEAIERMGRSARAAEPVLLEFVTCENRRVNQCVLDALAATGGDVEAAVRKMEPALAATSAAQRMEAVACMACAADHSTRAFDLVLKALDDPNKNVRWEAVQALEYTLKTRAADRKKALREALERERDEGVRDEIRMALKKV